MTFNCKILNKHRDFKKRFVILSNHWIDFYKNKHAVKAKFSEKMEDITWIYINSDENQLMLKTRQLPNIVLKTRHAVDVLRVLYAIKMHDECEVYQVPESDLETYMDDDTFPDSQYLVKEPGSGSIRDIEIDLNVDEEEWDLDEDEEQPTPVMSMGQKVRLLRALSSTTSLME